MHESLQRALEIHHQIATQNERLSDLVEDRAIHLQRAAKNSGLNPREIGEFFGVNRQRIYQMIEQGGLKMPSRRKNAG